MSEPNTKIAMAEAIKKLLDAYDDILSFCPHEPVTIFLQKKENAEKLSSLIVAINRFIRANGDDAGREIAEKITLVRKAILQDLQNRFKSGDKAVIACADTRRWHKPQDNYFSGAGKMPCPICGGELRYSRSQYNGHVHAKCMTNVCVAWME